MCGHICRRDQGIEAKLDVVKKRVDADNILNDPEIESGGRQNIFVPSTLVCYPRFCAVTTVVDSTVVAIVTPNAVRICVHDCSTRLLVKSMLHAC